MTQLAGDPVAASEINLGQARNAGPSTLGTADIAAAAYATDAQLDTITVPVVAGRKYRVSYLFHFGQGTAAAGNAWTVKIREGGAAGTQLTYASALIVATTAIDTRSVWVEWTAGTTGNQIFTTTAVRSSGANTIVFKGAASQPRILSVEWLGANA